MQQNPRYIVYRYWPTQLARRTKIGAARCEGLTQIEARELAPGDVDTFAFVRASSEQDAIQRYRDDRR